jgi:predicted nucleotidyltransferase component of viral defense system
MMNFDQIKNWFPENVRKIQYARYIYREYLQYIILDHLANSKYAGNLNFIGGTSLRLIHGINRFSEDLDFDHKKLSRKEFTAMTDALINFLLSIGYNIKADDKEKDSDLNAYRRNLVFPELLYYNKLSPFKEEKFLIKIESQDQKKKYQSEKVLMKGCGYVFYFNTPPLPVLCSMKISALLNRQKGRDFYDTMFLLGKTDADYGFFSKESGIKDKRSLKAALLNLCEKTNLKNKSKDFEHLLLNTSLSKQILNFPDFVKDL